jgi:hypothetical protein
MLGENMQLILGQLVVKLISWSTKEVNQLQFTELYIILVTLVVTETEVQQLLLMLHHFIFIKQFGSCICKIYVDDVLFHTVANTASLPFNKDFFLILNVAMGGTFGGAIDPAFTQSSMEIDYVRVYQ